MAVRVLISGDRNWHCADLARRVIARLVARHGEVDIVQGSADGVDFAFVEAAYDAGCGVCSFPADWEKHGKKAGPIRNAEMVAAGADFVIAVHRNLAWSRGTRDLVTRALAAGIPVYLIDGEDAEPKRIREIPGRGEGQSP
jgi:ABC-type sugar transport system substrate-binding protein